jgi:hypothetical protein
MLNNNVGPFWQKRHPKTYDSKVTNAMLTLTYYDKIKTKGVVVFNATFNNISVISWQSVLLVEKSAVPRENHRSATSHCQTLSHNVVSSTPRISRIRTHNFSADSHCLNR